MPILVFPKVSWVGYELFGAASINRIRIGRQKVSRISFVVARFLPRHALYNLHLGVLLFFFTLKPQCESL